MSYRARQRQGDDVTMTYRKGERERETERGWEKDREIFLSVGSFS